MFVPERQSAEDQQMLEKAGATASQDPERGSRANISLFKIVPLPVKPSAG